MQKYFLDIYNDISETINTICQNAIYEKYNCYCELNTITEYSDYDNKTAFFIVFYDVNRYTTIELHLYVNFDNDNYFDNSRVEYISMKSDKN